MKIVILERNSVGPDISVDILNELGEVTAYPNTVSVQEVRERTADAEIVVANKSPINEESLGGSKNVKLVCEFATGYDNCDLEYLKSRGIPVCNVVGYSTDMVAQHTFTLALSLSQNLFWYDDYVKSGKYSAQDRFSNFDIAFSELSGKTWGIVGMGNIGRKVAQIATAFGCRVIFTSVTGKSTVTEYEMVSKEELLKRSDFLSLHCPLSDITRNYIDRDALKMMKPSAYLINVARGRVVNNTDLYEAIESGEIAGAGLDVLEDEPLRLTNPLSRIKDSGKLIITPHLAWGSVEARYRCVQGVYDNIRAFLDGNPIHVVQ
ncbi:MAG: D-2-hydroxyacid dehydrogenase [Lachnospiraceae bacterium]|nr:D-2-hydroxyacid dehydrogenase [Lachnospiraceae bacterium]